MEYKKIESFKDLFVWQKGIELVNDIYKATKKFPKDELYCLTSQIRRAAISIPANIAEGWGRGTTKNYIQFLEISRGSLFELNTLIIISHNQEYIRKETCDEIENKLNEIGKMLNAMITKLESKNK
ncbi:MAG: four helix bundle protein [Bacteroidales bacterium]|nr:four helix bundle protein [Bacteroidales bacterium]